MKLIELYILRRVAIMFFAVLGAAVGITWTVQVLQRVDFLTTSGQSIQTIIQFSSLLIPSAIPLVMPFALIIAITQTLSTMNQDSELVVINASGAPRSAVMRPILMLAAIISVVSFLVANYVDPYARMNMRAMIANASADLLNVVVQEGSFRKLADNLYIQIAERRGDGSIGGLFIADSRDPTLDLIYYAADGNIASTPAGDMLLMKDGEVQRRDVSDGTVSIIKFNSYAFDLSQFTSAGDDFVIYAKDRPLTYLLNPDPNDPILQTRPLRYKAELHRRLTEWLYPVVFALIALAFAGDSRSHREARVSASFSAISTALLVYWAGYFSADRADKDETYIVMMYLVPIGVMLVTGFALLTGRRVGLPDKWNDRILDSFDRLKRNITATSDRLLGRSRKDTGGRA
ncbi:MULTISPECIES: LPS export ABC transporter permease LptF [Brucella]|jgi:lipopolysaccharide export system permease protein|uniref:LPS export ABC transporter permease LptF n=3 Tax=Brucella TaxID=234 RepID=A0A7Y3T473_9HYPH|nr:MULTISPECIES: LPS export ABC transporter permease LptF [Brucella]EMG54821.1 YjgP/YjgQ family permease [Ochrobactrum sp. CDB2]MBK0020637.1 LPS export ABC transporter permease LptF [Ochrobactrum sp. S45]MBK0042624.1 LPS export ABC transporter permease LptF [Ochrobactrum sp. S46]KAB2691289.1 LPS export ABC transporter permease LptF [Brucella pseudogrignonensis]MCM0751898.1 LPS export ABC transporter permease LptF [Brucella pseudogrignonensis]